MYVATPIQLVLLIWLPYQWPVLFVKFIIMYFSSILCIRSEYSQHFVLKYLYRHIVENQMYLLYLQNVS
jgi:hypothetical protein